MEEQDFLRAWAQKEACLIPQAHWESHRLVSNDTLEHEVRFREEDRRALKKTWPGTFGFVPALNGNVWEPRVASAAEYLHRFHLQNTLFGDEIRLEGAMIQQGRSLIVGQPEGSFSFVISQPWLEAEDNLHQFPTEQEVDEHLRSLGFEPLRRSFYGWQGCDSSLIILDAKPNNFISTSAGIIPIDLLLAEIPTAGHATPADA